MHTAALAAVNNRRVDVKRKRRALYRLQAPMQTPGACRLPASPHPHHETVSHDMKSQSRFSARIRRVFRGPHNTGSSRDAAS
ncbi:hypothetical protein ebA5094 [Aromatoleum aromaticum EbN1]|uniref:Uncharacterized protein n=1 Tax=Aromatoleum aromaticum (strain DSM 19018 / LMG 30748 / EbN1) TaxID=76114 RepID=Q5P100_AROAE|nr:hypothetical protein ebA5094 [Aromatoleum aromaticum EbN1]